MCIAGMLIENANVDDDADEAVERQSALISTHYMHIAVHILSRSLSAYIVSIHSVTNKPAKNPFRRGIVYVSTFKLICARALTQRLDVCGMHFY